MTRIAAIAQTLDALQRCQANPDQYAGAIPGHEARIRELCDGLPSGSGWDCGTALDDDKSGPNRIVFYGSYHHMDDDGYYDGWTEHTIIVTPSIAFGFDVRVTGRDRNNVKEYLAEMFRHTLGEEVAR